MSTTKTFKVNSKELSAKLSQVVGVINPSNTMPVLENVLFQSLGEQGKIKLTASDLETTFSNEIKAEYASEVKVCVPGKLLLDIIKTFADQPLTFTVENSTLSISSSTGRYEIACSNADEYPSAPIIEDVINFSIDAAELNDNISKTIFAVLSDDLRPVLNGVLIQLFDGQVNFVATDGNKMIYVQNQIESVKESVEFILPKKPMNLIKSYCSNAAGEVQVFYNNVNARFVFGESELICRLIDGKYPTYKNVIPPNEKEITINRYSLLQSIDRVIKFSNKSSNQIKVSVKDSQLEIYAEDIDYNNKAVENLACTWSENKPFEIGFNGRFILEVLKAIETEDVAIKVSDPRRGAIIYPLENGAINENHISLVMPVLLNPSSAKIN